MILEEGQLAINNMGLVLQYLGGKQVKCIKVGQATGWSIGKIEIYSNHLIAQEFSDKYWKRYFTLEDYLEEAIKI